jgi:uncharacterized membrane protein
MKKSFVAGLVILLPLALTLLIAKFLFDLFTTPFLPIVQSILTHFSYTLPEKITIFLSRLIGLMLLIVLIFFLGFITRHFFFNKLLQLGDQIVFRIPLIKTIYKLSRDIFSALFSPDGKKIFKETVIFPFPHKPHYGIGFSAGEVPEECERKAGVSLVAVFAPTAPHPISGFLFLVPKKNVHPVKMSKEDAIKYLISCGVVHPEIDNIDEYL